VIPSSMEAVCRAVSSSSFASFCNDIGVYPSLIWPPYSANSKSLLAGQERASDLRYLG
jgi:hypothetical protein